MDHKNVCKISTSLVTRRVLLTSFTPMPLWKIINNTRCAHTYISWVQGTTTFNFPRPGSTRNLTQGQSHCSNSHTWKSSLHCNSTHWNDDSTFRNDLWSLTIWSIGSYHLELERSINFYYSKLDSGVYAVETPICPFAFAKIFK